MFTSEEVLARVSMAQAASAIERAFLALDAGYVVPPVSVAIAVPGGSFHAKACASLVPGATPFYVAKINSNFPGNPAGRGLPTIQGVIAAFDAANGRLLALADSAAITSLRTAATTAIAIRRLARKAARVATLVGCGALGRFHLRALAECGLSSVNLLDRDEARAREVAAWAREALGLECRRATNLRAATLASDVIVTCTTSTSPFLGAEDVRPGTFVAAVGADSDRKSEIQASLLARARIVTDLAEQCRKSGDLRNAVPNEAFVCGDLVDVVAGRVARTADDEVVLFDSSGLAIEDLAVCAELLAAEWPGLKARPFAPTCRP